MTTDTPEQTPVPEGEAREELRKLEPVLAAVQPSAAASIMSNPAGAATAASPPTKEVMIQRCLDALPGLVGGIDAALKDQTGKHHPFSVLIWSEGVAMHAANFNPTAARDAIIELGKEWDTTGNQPVEVQPGAAANEDSTNSEGGGAPAAGDDKPHVTH